MSAGKGCDFVNLSIKTQLGLYGFIVGPACPPVQCVKDQLSWRGNYNDENKNNISFSAGFEFESGLFLTFPPFTLELRGSMKNIMKSALI